MDMCPVHVERHVMFNLDTLDMRPSARSANRDHVDQSRQARRPDGCRRDVGWLEDHDEEVEGGRTPTPWATLQR